MSDPRGTAYPPAGPAAANDAEVSAAGASPRATVTGTDGTVLATISRHTERPGGSSASPLIVVEVSGDVDRDTAPMLCTTLTRAIGRNGQVCCDLSRVGFLGAAGVNTIFAAMRAADDAGCAFTVRGVHGISAYVFEITGLDAVLASRRG